MTTQREKNVSEQAEAGQGFEVAPNPNKKKSHGVTGRFIGRTLLIKSLPLVLVGGGVGAAYLMNQSGESAPNNPPVREDVGAIDPGLGEGGSVETEDGTVLTMPEEEPAAEIPESERSLNLISNMNSGGDVVRHDIAPEFWTPAVIEAGNEYEGRGISAVFNRSVALLEEAVRTGDMSIIDDSIAESEEFPDRHQAIYESLTGFLAEPMEECVKERACVWDNFNENLGSGEDYQDYQQLLAMNDGTFVDYVDYFRLKSGQGENETVHWEGFIYYQAENNDPSDPYGWRILRFEPTEVYTN